MVRKQLYIDVRHERDLKRRASELGVSEAELVRRALDASLGGVEARVSMYPDRTAAVNRLRAAWSTPSSSLTQRLEREAHYDEREDRIRIQEGATGDGTA